MFKKILTTIALTFLLATTSFAMDWHAANQASVAWDEVTALADGDALPSGDLITYRLYLRGAAPDSPAIFQKEVTDLSYTYTFVEEGGYYAGVSAMRYIDVNSDGVFDDDDLDAGGQPFVSESVIVWSEDSTPAFGIRFYKQPAGPTGLIKN